MPEQELELFPQIANDYPTAYLTTDSTAPHISEVRIQNFKGIEDSTVTLAKFSVLTGVNNAGKSTILQAIWVAFECLRLCVDRSTWQIADAGRALAGFDFLPANEPEDLFFKRRYRGRTAARPIVIRILLSDGFYFETHIRLLFGAINVKVADWNRPMGAAAVRQAVALSPILIPGHVEIGSHEESKVPAQIHKHALSGQLSAIIRNVLLTLSKDVPAEEQTEPGFDFVANAIATHFDLQLERITFDPERDLEIRAPYTEDECNLDIVSAGSGLHQILKLGAFIAWRKARIVLLDEPDAHLHTSLQARLSLFLHKLSEDGNIQFVLATHSRDLISRSPLQSVIPIDASQRQIRPISEVEHLLTEFRRLGPVGNFDVALLYQTKRCLFVEGPSDVTWLPLIAAKLGSPIFTGPHQFVLFEFKGVEKFTLVKDLAELFQRMVGAQMTWFVMRDREASIPRVLTHLQEQAVTKGIANFHIWSRYSLENYLLEPANVIATVQHEANSRSVVPPSNETITTILEQACNDVFQNVRADFITAAQNYFIRHSLVENQPRENATTETLAYLDQCTSLQARLELLPGYKVYGKFVERLQQQVGITFRFESLIENLKPATAPAELTQLLTRLGTLQPQA